MPIVSEKIYRGIVSSLNDIKNGFDINPVKDMFPPNEPLYNENGEKVVYDGNEYGVYMSDNISVADIYAGKGSMSAKSSGENFCYIKTINEFYSLSAPTFGVVYEISTKGLSTLKNPKITQALSGVYNNGFAGDEWIADSVPKENIEVKTIFIHKDLLHEQEIAFNTIKIDNQAYIYLNENYTPAMQAITNILEERRKMMSVFAEDLKKIIPKNNNQATIKNTDKCILNDFDFDIKFYRKIYGNNGAKYQNKNEISTSSPKGMFKYLFTTIYQANNDYLKNPENIDYSKLKYINNLEKKFFTYEKKYQNINNLLNSEYNQILKNRENFLKNNPNSTTNGFDSMLNNLNEFIEIINSKGSIENQPQK